MSLGVQRLPWSLKSLSSDSSVGPGPSPGRPGPPGPGDIHCTVGPVRSVRLNHFTVKVKKSYCYLKTVGQYEDNPITVRRVEPGLRALKL